jgi:hypothetical protein
MIGERCSSQSRDQTLTPEPEFMKYMENPFLTLRITSVDPTIHIKTSDIHRFPATSSRHSALLPIEEKLVEQAHHA